MAKGKENGSKFAETEPINREQKRIAQWLRKVKFRKQLLGGVSERDVWKKISELNDMYNAALEAERVRCDALIEQLVKEHRIAEDARIDRDLTGGERG